MQRLLMRRMSQVEIPAERDRVLFGCSLPANSVVHGVSAQLELLGPVQVAYLRAYNYAVETWILPVLDPDSGAALDAVFDTMVPKDSDIDAIDLDTSAAGDGSFYEPGEIDWTQVFDVGVEGKRLTALTQMITAASKRSVVIQAPTDNTQMVWTAMDTQNVRWSAGDGGFRVKDPSVLVCAFGNPAADDVTAVAETILAETEWARVQYISDMLTHAYYQLSGITGAVGASPWQEATDLIQKVIDPDVYADTSGFWSGARWNVLSKARIDMSVEGKLKIGILSGGR